MTCVEILDKSIMKMGSPPTYAPSKLLIVSSIIGLSIYSRTAVTMPGECLATLGIAPLDIDIANFSIGPAKGFLDLLLEDLDLRLEDIFSWKGSVAENS